MPLTNFETSMVRPSRSRVTPTSNQDSPGRSSAGFQLMGRNSDCSAYAQNSQMWHTSRTQSPGILNLRSALGWKRPGKQSFETSTQVSCLETLQGNSSGNLLVVFRGIDVRTKCRLHF